MPAPDTNAAKTAALARWLLNPFAVPTVAEIYEAIATDAISESGLYLNLGYWRTADTIDAACADLVRLLGETAELERAETVVDVGYGFGDQDIAWARRFAPGRIIGFNITASQVATARQRVEAAGLTERVDLRQGSATAMPLPDASADVVLALECAFHFDTRAAFFREAARVLRPGGRLVLGDIIPTQPRGGPGHRAMQRAGWALTSRVWQIPAANADTPAGYAGKLRAAGFADVRIESIRDDVYVPLHRHLAAHPAHERRFHPIMRLPLKLARHTDPERLFCGLDYVLASARKAA